MSDAMLNFRDELGPGDCGLIFHADSSASLLVPKLAKSDQVPLHMLAATECACLVQDEEGLQKLADAFTQRSKS